MTSALLPARDAAAARTGRRPGVKSSEARRMILDLLGVEPLVRREVMRSSFKEKEWKWLLEEVHRETGTPYGLWHDTPSGFIEDVIGETLWGTQRELVDAIIRYKRVAVPAGFGVGKTFIVGRLVAWAGATNPVGQMKVVTIATNERQVKRQMWPHIRTSVAKGKLLGTTDVMQWRAPDGYGNDVVIAYGFSSAEDDEAAMQGVHGTPRLLLAVDEAGGIGQVRGRGTNNLMTGDARMIATGNPPMNDPGSWFEGLCASGEDPEDDTTVTCRIAAVDSPAMTGEPTPVCRACVPNLDGHTIAEGTNGESHLPDKRWLRTTFRDYGAAFEDDAAMEETIRTHKDPGVHPYLTSKVFARFPKDGSRKVMPMSWVQAAQDCDDPTGREYERLCDLGLDGETGTFTVAKGSWVRLGVDIAADGGDEFAIYRSVGDVVHRVHVGSGSVNQDSMDVSEEVLRHIMRAQALAARLGTKAPVRVKVDTNGLGWGVAGNLDRWAQTKRHAAQIVHVNVSEKPHKEDPAAIMRPAKKRDELWLAGRWLLQPDPDTGLGRWRLRLDHGAFTQLSLPDVDYNLAGYTVVESKRSMRARGVASPDRAEAALLSVYEPFPLNRNRRRGLIVG